MGLLRQAAHTGVYILIAVPSTARTPGTEGFSSFPIAQTNLCFRSVPYFTRRYNCKYKNKREKKVSAIFRLLFWCLAGFTAARIVRSWQERRRLARYVDYQAYTLSAESRQELLSRFPPRHEKVFADHITYAYPAPEGAGPPPAPGEVRVVGYAADASLEALIVSVDGTTTRHDGHTYHITLSCQPERRAHESNQVIADVIAASGWQAVSESVLLTVEPELRSHLA